MNWQAWLVLSGIVGLVAAFLYWELIVAEGAHFGSRVVVLLYDRAARRYESIKQFDSSFEDDCLGYPITRALVTITEPLVLDVATGTGRLPRTLLRQTAFDGRVVALDLSWHMLQAARREIRFRPEAVDPVYSPASALPFADSTFDAVTCLEALEFMPDPAAALAECVRVLRAGGWLVVSNRVGLSARWLPGKTFSRPAFASLLESNPLEALNVQPWQQDYDLIWARKSSLVPTRSPNPVPEKP